MPEDRIAVDDPEAADVRLLLEQHLAFARATSTPQDVHALDTGGGVGRALLRHLLGMAQERGYGRLSLETGTQPAFAPARALYERGVQAVRALRAPPPEPQQQLLHPRPDLGPLAHDPQLAIMRESSVHRGDHARTVHRRGRSCAIGKSLTLSERAVRSARRHTRGTPPARPVGCAPISWRRTSTTLRTFESGLERLLDGIGVLVERATGTQSRS